ncbi:UNVERIFIED_CONTAM: hypothetical protein Q9R71_35490 [Actinomycetes bacterium ARC8]|nr:hypothetical protein [Actinomycetes bacterium ARC8]
MFADKKKRIAFICVAILTMLGIGIALFVFNKPQPQPEPQAVSGSGLSLGGTNEYGFQTVLLDPKAQGSKVAADRKTRYGYTSTCGDAVAAAFNYTDLLGDFSAENLGAQNETYHQIAIAPEEYSQTDDGSLEGLKFDSDTSIGLFKIGSCAEGQSAQIVTTQIIKSQIPGVDTTYLVQSLPINLVWDGDWKLGERDEATELREEIESSSAPTIDKALLDALFTDAEGASIDRKAWYALDSKK